MKKYFKVNITDFGGEGNGCSDDSAAFEAAINSRFEFICVPLGRMFLIEDPTVRSMMEACGVRFLTCLGSSCSCQRRRRLVSR